MAASKKNPKSPDETRKFNRGKLEVVKVGGFTFGRATFRAGWKWSNDIKPMAKTESCQTHHVGYIVSGSLAGVMDDGTKWRMNAGDFVDIPPGHDAWTIGKKSVVMLDFMSAAAHADE